jgi:rhodanese-related sulfurtransferase
MRRALLLTVIALVAGCGGHGGTLAPAPPPTTTIPLPPAVASVSPTDISALVEGQEVTILDVRTPEEFAVGHLQGARMIDYEAGGFGAAIVDLPHEGAYLLYSNGDARAVTAAQEMIDAGFVDVRDMVGGYDAWVAAGLPVES